MVYASARDRTKEFQELAEFFKRRNPTGSQKDDEPSTSQPVQPSPQKLSDFNRRAAGIGQQISDCSGRLRTLAKLAKQASTFDDPTQKINELTLVIKQDLQQLNHSISELQQLATRDAGSTGRQGSNHSVSVVNNLRNRLKGTTDDFKKVLEERKDSLKRQSERRQQYSALSETSMPLLPTSGPSFLDSSYETHGDGASSSQAQQQQMVAHTDQYLSSRAEALTQVESAISELAGMFNQLAVMVQEQGELAIRIDENVDETLANVDSAQGQLLKYLQTISGNRMLIIKVFAVIVVFLVLFIMVS